MRMQCFQAAEWALMTVSTGGAYLQLFAHCVDAGMEMVNARHEAIAAHMAGAYARLTGKIRKPFKMISMVIFCLFVAALASCIIGRPFRKNRRLPARLPVRAR
jgi:hypothetical protein